jgi:uncharacterized protein YgiM (DUF1202 family)
MKKTIAKSLLCLTLALTLIVGLSAPAYAKVGSVYRVNASGVHLRTAPRGGEGHDGNIIASLGKGTKVVHLSTKDGWWRVRTTSGKVGYVYRSFLTAVSSNSNSTTTVSSGNTYKVKASSLNVRSGASTSYKMIGRLKKGTAVYVVATNGTWAKIRVKSGKTGYVAVRYIG